MEENQEYEWPTDKGIWMGYFEGVEDWIPMLTDEMKDDLPSQEQLRLEKEDPENAPPRKTLLIVAQQPVPPEAGVWPYTFQGCHSATKWRRPTDEELEKARIFHGISKEGAEQCLKK